LESTPPLIFFNLFLEVALENPLSLVVNCIITKTVMLAGKARTGYRKFIRKWYNSKLICRPCGPIRKEKYDEAKSRRSIKGVKEHEKVV
jgi:hypothetical protein